MYSNPSLSRDDFPLTDSQYLVAAILGMITTSLSVMGSSAIMYILWLRSSEASGTSSNTNRCWKFPRLQSTYQRIMLGLSISDMCFSASYFWQSITFPQITELPLAVGNMQTCRATGFFNGFVNAGALFNAALSWYFLRSVQRSRKSKVDVRCSWCETTGHGAAFFVSILLSTYAVATDRIQPLPVGVCFIGPAAEAGKNGLKGHMDIFVLISMIIGVISGIVGIVCTLLVFLTVNRQLRRAKRYSFPAPSEPSILSSSTLSNSVSSSRDRQRKAMAVQTLLYTLAFLNTLAGMLMIFFARAYTSFTFLVFAKLMLPLQGFYNFLVFVKPDITRLRQRHSEQSLWWAYRQLFAESSSSSLHERSGSHNQGITDSHAGHSGPSSLPMMASSANQSTSILPSGSLETLHRKETSSDSGPTDLERLEEQDRNIDTTLP